MHRMQVKKNIAESGLAMQDAKSKPGVITLYRNAIIGEGILEVLSTAGGNEHSAANFAILFGPGNFVPSSLRLTMATPAQFTG
jgi:hypothetical protein